MDIPLTETNERAIMKSGRWKLIRAILEAYSQCIVVGWRLIKLGEDCSTLLCTYSMQF